MFDGLKKLKLKSQFNSARDAMRAAIRTMEDMDVNTVSIRQDLETAIEQLRRKVE